MMLAVVSLAIVAIMVAKAIEVNGKINFKN